MRFAIPPYSYPPSRRSGVTGGPLVIVRARSRPSWRSRQITNRPATLTIAGADEDERGRHLAEDDIAQEKAHRIEV